MTEKQIVVRHGTLNRFLGDLFAKAGLSAPDAAFHAQALVDSNLWGIDSHGVLRVPVYIRRLRSGAVNPRPNITAARGALGLEVLDGDNGPGFLVGRDAMLRAMALAEKYNIGMVGAARSNHFGAAAIYARMAARQGMVGIAMTNVVQNIAAPGGSAPVVGNNPIAAAIPTFGDFPFVLDISLSTVARGKLLLASKQGKSIPPDWATDREGHPTRDPDEAFKGFLSPAGGYKGLGLAYVVDILCGVITGGAFLGGLKDMYRYPDDPNANGHMMVAINLEAIISRQEMQQRMAAFIQTVQDSPMWAEDQEMRIPGEGAYHRAQARKANGIPLPESLYAELTELGEALGAQEILSPAT